VAAVTHRARDDVALAAVLDYPVDAAVALRGVAEGDWLHAAADVDAASAAVAAALAADLRLDPVGVRVNATLGEVEFEAAASTQLDGLRRRLSASAVAAASSAAASSETAVVPIVMHRFGTDAAAAAAAAAAAESASAPSAVPRCGCMATRSEPLPLSCAATAALGASSSASQAPTSLRPLPSPLPSVVPLVGVERASLSPPLHPLASARAALASRRRSLCRASAEAQVCRRPWKSSSGCSRLHLARRRRVSRAGQSGGIVMGALRGALRLRHAATHFWQKRRVSPSSVATASARMCAGHRLRGRRVIRRSTGATSRYLRRKRVGRTVCAGCTVAARPAPRCMP
jgi:hypothetical protein